jgi:hypothetical protein
MHRKNNMQSTAAVPIAYAGVKPTHQLSGGAS